MKSGVPQGSMLGPFYSMLLLICDSICYCSRLLSAEDLKIFRQFRNVGGSKLLQPDIQFFMFEFPCIISVT